MSFPQLLQQLRNSLRSSRIALTDLALRRRIRSLRHVDQVANEKKGRGEKVKIIFICTGNILRSAYADATFRSLVRDAVCCSRGTKTTTGQSADPAGIKIAAKSGIDLSQHTATSLGDGDIGSADLLVIMEPRHEVELYALAPGRELPIVYLGALEGGWLSSPRIADPYGKSDEIIDECFVRVSRCVKALVSRLNLTER